MRDISETELLLLEERFADFFACENYRVVVNHNDTLTQREESEVVCLGSINGFQVYILSADAPEETVKEFENQMSGFSGFYKRVEELFIAFEEAVQMRKKYFLPEA